MVETNRIPNFGELSVFVGDLRSLVFKTQSQAARHFGVYHTTIGRYERNETTPPLEYLACLAVLVAERLTAEGIRHEKQLQRLLAEVNEAIFMCYPDHPPFRTWDDLRKAADAYNPKPLSGHPISHSAPASMQDWGTAPVIGRFFGRTDVLERLNQWIIHDRCRIVGIVGIGGVGKTSVATALAKQVMPHFARFIWRSLRDAPPLVEILNDCIRFLSDQQIFELPTSSEQRITMLINLLRQQGCLLVLDNCESILKQGTGAGRYQEGYESYGELLRAMGTTDHQSCLILTSRDLPAHLALLSSDRSFVRTWTLTGLDRQAVNLLLEESNLQGSTEELTTLAAHFSGNPLALQLVAGTICTLFSGKIADFLQVGIAFLGDVRNLLDEQFQRLSQEEREILYWLAILREPILRDELMLYMLPSLPQHRLIETLQDLQRRCWLETGNGFGLQNVILEYLTERLVSKMSDEIITCSPERFNRHALILAQSTYYIRDVQIRLLLQPVLQRLSEVLGKVGTLERILELKLALQQRSVADVGYAGANVFHLLAYLNQGDLRYQDFSRLAIRQAVLYNVDLRDTNFSRADLSGCAFAEIFGLVNTLAFSPNGTRLAIGTGNDIVQMWHVVSPDLGKLQVSTVYKLDEQMQFNSAMTTAASYLGTDREHKISSVIFHPHGEILAGGYSNGSIYLWETRYGRQLRVLTDHKVIVHALAFDATGNILASASDDYTVRLWDTHTWECTDVLEGHTDRVHIVAFHPTRTLLASGSEDGSIRLWDISTRRCLHILCAEQKFSVTSLAFNQDGSLLASGDSYGVIRFWNLETQKWIKVLVGHKREIKWITFSPDGSLLASASADWSVRLWHVSTDDCVQVINHHKSSAEAVAFHPSGDLLATGSHDGTMRLWSVRTGLCLAIKQGFRNRIWAVAASPIENLLASGGDDHQIELRSMETGECNRILVGHINDVKALSFHPNGQIVASGAYDSTIRLWHVASGECIHVLHGHMGDIRSLAFSSDGRVLASGSHDKTIRLWNVDTGRCFCVLQESTDLVRSVLFSPDDSMVIASGFDCKVRLWDAQTGEFLKIYEGHKESVWSLAVCRDGNLLASADYNIVHLWDLRSGECVASFTGCWPVIFHPNNKMLFILDRSRLLVQLIDIRDGQLLRSYSGAVDFILSLTISADGQVLVGGGDDGVIRLWNIETGECMKRLEPERPYERMDITGVRGLTEPQKASLRRLGAINHAEG